MTDPVDLSVYRFGGRAVLDGLSLYAGSDPATGLPFTYPPFAALLMVPVALLPGWAATVIWTAASAASLVAVVAVVRRALGLPAPARLLVPLAVAASTFEPVWQHFWLGQVNLLLMLAVLVDLLRADRRWAGVLVGVAAGIKLTPLVFVVLLVLVGRRTAAGRALLSFAVTVGIGFLALPGASAWYWTDALVDPGRVGGPAFATNQSAYGALIRLLDGPPPTLLWLAVAGPLALGTLLVGAAWWRRGDPVLGTCLGGLAMLLASPISWSHHWVWAVPVALVLWERARPAAVGWTTVFVVAPVWWPPHREQREYSWRLVDHLLGNGYLVAALLLAAGSGRALARVGREREEPTCPSAVGPSSSS